MNQSKSILGPKGTPFVNLGGERAYKTFHKGDVIGELQWIDVQATDPQFEESGPVPCLCLYHAHRRATTGAYVIPQVNAFAYAKSDGVGIPNSFLVCIANVVTELGFDLNDKAAKHRVFDLVLECMPDLIRMPSDQPDALEMKRGIQGIETTVRVGDNIVHQEVQ